MLETTKYHATNFANSPNDTIQQHGQRLRQELDAAHSQLQNGEIEFIDALAKTDEELQQAQNAVQLDNEQRALALQRQTLVRRTIITMLWIIGAIVAAILWWSNRRRAITMHKALEQWVERDQSVRKETDQLDKLFQRNDDILGSREQIVQRGYVGTTKELALKAIDYVDDLLIMSKEVKRVLNEAKALIHPRHPWNQIVNLFSSAQYQEAINHITGSPLKFQRSTGLPLIIRDMNIGKASAAQTDGIPDEVQLTFEEIFTALQKRGIEAQQALGTIEDCLTNVQDRLTESQTQLETAAAQEKELDAQSAGDGYFDVPAYFSTLIPAIGDNLKQADDLSAFDAVQAVQGPLAIAQRQLSEAMTLGRHLLQARRELLPKLQSDAQALKQRGYSSNWIGASLATLTGQADTLLKQAVEQSIAVGIQALTNDIDQLGQRSSRNRRISAADPGTTLAQAVRVGRRDRTDAARSSQRFEAVNRSGRA